MPRGSNSAGEISDGDELANSSGPLSLGATELSFSEKIHHPSLGKLTTVSSHAEPRTSLHSADLTEMRPSLGHHGSPDSLHSSDFEWDPIPERLDFGREEVSLPPTNGSLGNTSSLVYNQQSDLDFSHGDSNLSEEARFLNEVEDYIGNPEDWTDSSDNELIQGDLPGVKVLDEGLVDEEFAEEEFIELYEESTLLLPTINNFLYENEAGLSPPPFPTL